VDSDPRRLHALLGGRLEKKEGIMNEVIEHPGASTALTIIPQAAVPTILAMTGAPDILKSLSDELAAFKPDISTPKGRAAIASMAAKVATAKMDIVRIANSTTEEWRTKTKLVVSERNDLEERMDALKAEVRAPLTEFENAEKERVAGHEKALAAISEAPRYGHTESSDELRERLAHLRDYPARDWQEFATRATQQLEEEIERTQALLASAVKREAEAAELEHLRAEAAENARKEAERAKAEHEARIAAEAAERARIEAERKAAEEAAAAERKAREEREAAERAARSETEAAARREREAMAEAERAKRAAEQAEADLLAAIERERIAKEKAEIDRVAAAEKAERDRMEAEIAAVEAERRRQSAAAKAEADAAAAREKDRAHKSKIMGEAKLALIEHASIDEAMAVAVVKAIVAGKISHTSVRF
jgi:hypothetical protein